MTSKVRRLLERVQTNLKLGTKEYDNIRIQHAKDRLQWNYQLGYFRFEGQRRWDFSELEIGEKAITWCLNIQIKHGWIFLKAYVGQNQSEKYGEHRTYKSVYIHFQESDEYKSLGGNLEECSRFLIDIRAKRASNLYIDE